MILEQFSFGYEYDNDDDDDDKCYNNNHYINTKNVLNHGKNKKLKIDIFVWKVYGRKHRDISWFLYRIVDDSHKHYHS